MTISFAAPDHRHAFTCVRVDAAMVTSGARRHRADAWDRLMRTEEQRLGTTVKV
jgi:hypothetical protein